MHLHRKALKSEIRGTQSIQRLGGRRKHELSATTTVYKSTHALLVPCGGLIFAELNETGRTSAYYNNNQQGLVVPDSWGDHILTSLSSPWIIASQWSKAWRNATFVELVVTLMQECGKYSIFWIRSPDTLWPKIINFSITLGLFLYASYLLHYTLTSVLHIFNFVFFKFFELDQTNYVIHFKHA
jgi:hypothetical protein